MRTKVRVLELSSKLADFIEDNEDIESNLIVEEGGLYMKIKPTGFDMNSSSATARTFEGTSHLRRATNTYTAPNFGTGDNSTNNFVPYSLGAGSSVRIFIEISAKGAIAFKDTYDKTFRANSDYNSIMEWFNAEVVDLGSFGNDSTADYGFAPFGENFFVKPNRDGTASRSISTTVRFEVRSTDGIIIFETEAEETSNNVYYETEQTFEIIGGYHQGNLQNQTETQATAIIELDFFNCYAQGNGAESYRYKDTFNSKFLNIDLRPSATSVDKYKAIRRFSDLTYSAVYNENTNVNGLNEFNLATLNYKEDLDKSYGFIQKLYSKDTDLLVFQEDKVSRVLYGKDLLMNADGSSNITSTESVLGQQIAYAGEYGISRNPESFAFDSNQVYFTDSKRGCVCRLSANGITEISMAGMVNFFKESYKGSSNTKKLGAFDPYYDQYVLHNDDNSVSMEVNIPCSGSSLRNGFMGTLVINIDYGFAIGNAGFNYSSNGVPVKYDIEYDGTTYSTGFLGSSVYDAELASLGLPPVSGLGDGVFELLKDKSVPTIFKVTVTAPLSGLNFQIDGNCVDTDTIRLTSIILNGQEDSGLTMKSRYRWGNQSYSSPFKTYSNLFEGGEVDIFEVLTGQEGSSVIPLGESTVEVQSYKGYSETGQFSEGDRIGYLISNTVYGQLALQDILDLATFVTPTKFVGIGGDTTDSISFPFTRLTDEENLYIIWDYRGVTNLLDDEASVANSGTVNINVLDNDTVLGGVQGVIISTPPVNGTATLEVDNTITYVHDGTNTYSDTLVYSVDEGSGYNISANVNITIQPIPTEFYSYEGVYASNDPAHPNGGSLDYVDENGAPQSLTLLFSGTCVTFISQSQPTNLVGVATCIPVVTPTLTCITVEWGLGGLTEDTFVTISYKDCSGVDQSIGDYVGNLGGIVQLVGLDTTFYASHGTITQI